MLSRVTARRAMFAAISVAALSAACAAPAMAQVAGGAELPKNAAPDPVAPPPTSVVTPTGAQSSTAAPAQVPGTVAEVVVTATREAQVLSRTPAAITALSSDQLIKSGVNDLSSLQNVVPNLSVGNQFGVNRTFIRGIGLTSIDLGADGSVAFLQDGAIVSRPAAQLSGFYDVERVEVLRGPQGTLYGRGATGGAINLITRQPTSTPEGYIRATVGDYGQKGVEAAFGGPIVQDKLLGRLSVNYDAHDGYGKNLYTGSDIDDRDAHAVRGALTYIASPTLKATISAETFNESDNNYAFHYFGPTIIPDAGLPHNLAGGKSIFDYYAARGQTPDLRNIYSNTDPINRRNGTSFTGTIDWSPGAFDLKSITSYRNFSRRNIDDLSVSDASAPATDITNGKIYGLNDYHEKSETISQDFLGSYKADRWNALVGFSYFNESNYGVVNVPTPGLSLLLDPTNSLPPAVRNVIDTGQYLQQGTVDTDAYGVFVQGTYNILDNLKFTAGLRYSYEERSGVGEFVFTGIGVDIPTDKKKGWGALTPKFTLDYQYDPNTLFYATISRGFRSGVINIGSTNAVINPEYVWDYEGGIKIKAFENRVSASFSAFYYDYTDLQVGFVNAQSIVETVNAAAARNYGVELETHAAVTPALTVDFFATYLNAKFTDFLDSNYRTGFTPENLAGNTLANAPEYTLRLGATYDLPLGRYGDLSLHAEGNYQSKVYFTEFNNSDAYQGGRAIYDASLRYTHPNGHWTLDLWGKNLTDRFVVANNIVAAATFGFVRVGSLLPPRTFGATLGYKF